MLACDHQNTTRVTGKLPISPCYYIDLYSLKDGKKVLADTSYQEKFELNADSLEKGIYQIVFSWDRNILKPAEIERFARQPELGVPKYFMSALFWLDYKESNSYTFQMDSMYRQSDLEEGLLTKDEGESLKMNVVSSGKNNLIFNKYLKLVDHYRAKNKREKDSLRRIVTLQSNSEVYDEVGLTTRFLAADWLPNVKTALLREEINFMKNNIDSEVVPMIYQIQVNSKDDFETYKAVFQLFPTNVKQALGRPN